MEGTPAGRSIEVNPRHGHLITELRRKIQDLLARGFNDPRIRGLVSVTGVELSSDMGELRVNVSVLPGEHGPLTLEGLRSAAGRMQADLAPSLRLRRIPVIRFELDDSLKRLAALDAALARDNPGTDSNSVPASRDEDESP